MATICSAKVKSRVKGHHVYNYDYFIGEVLQCRRERNNRHSDNAIVVQKVKSPVKSEVKVKKKKNEDITAGHVPEALSEVLSPLMEDGTITRIEAVVDGEHRPAPEGTWVTGGGIEIPCTYRVYSTRENKSKIRTLIRAEQNL